MKCISSCFVRICCCKLCTVAVGSSQIAQDGFRCSLLCSAFLSVLTLEVQAQPATAGPGPTLFESNEKNVQELQVRRRSMTPCALGPKTPCNALMKGFRRHICVELILVLRNAVSKPTCASPIVYDPGHHRSARQGAARPDQRAGGKGDTEHLQVARARQQLCEGMHVKSSLHSDKTQILSGPSMLRMHSRPRRMCR